MKNTVYCIASTEPQANDISHTRTSGSRRPNNRGFQQSCGRWCYRRAGRRHGRTGPHRDSRTRQGPSRAENWSRRDPDCSRVG